MSYGGYISAITPEGGVTVFWEGDSFNNVNEVGVAVGGGSLGVGIGPLVCKSWIKNL